MIPSVETRGSSAQVPASTPRRGWLRHGNPPGDYAKAPRCGARTRCGGCCRQPAMRNGRCRMHGGLSTGPRTAAGLARALGRNVRPESGDWPEADDLAAHVQAAYRSLQAQRTEDLLAGRIEFISPGEPAP